jgi:uncharacterized membrane protein YbhN (UPF0104 family)
MARAPRDPQRLLREIDTAVKLREIREWEALREGLEVRFTEFSVLAGVFCFSLALILTLIFALPQENEAAYYTVLLWSVGYILATVVTLEFLIRKFRILRRITELNNRRIERLEKQLAAMEKAGREAAAAPAE